jgi:outer membrane protein assembly complex protein YaeT
MKRRLLRRTLYISAAVVLILLLGLALLHTPPVMRFAFNRARQYLHDKSSIDIQASSFRFNLFKSEATIEDLTIKSSTAPGLPPIFRANRIKLKIGVRHATKGFWDLEELQIEAPEFHYFIGADGKTNLPQSTSASKAAPDFLITRGEVTGGVFRYEDVRRRFTVAIPQWQLRISGDRHTRNHHFEFSGVKESSLNYQTYVIPIDQLNLSGTFQRTALQIDTGQIRAAGSQLSLAGSVKDFSKPFVDLKLNPNLSLNRIGQILNLVEPIEGSLSGSIRITGGLQQAQISAELKGADISSGGYRRTRFDLKSRAELNPDRLFIRGMKIDSPDGSLNGSAELVLQSGSGASTIEAALNNFALSPVWTQIRAPFNLASRSAGNISIRWKGPFSLSGIAGDAHLNLMATRKTPGRNLLPLSGTLNVQIRPGQILGNLQSFAVLGANVSGPFSLKSFTEIDGDFHGDTLNIDTLISQLSQFLGSSDNPLGSMRMTGPLQFTARMSGKLGRPAVTIAAEAPALQSGILKHLSVKADAALEGSQITFQSAITLPQSGKLTANGALELGGPQPTMNLDLSGDRLPVPSVMAMLDSTVPVTGGLKAEMHLIGPVDNLAGRASIRGDALSLYREPLGYLDMDLRLDGKEIQSTKFILLRDPENPDSDRIDANFTYSLDSDQFKFRANGKTLKWKDLTLPDGSPVDAQADLAASGSGTLDHLTIDLKMDTDDLRLRQQSLGPVSLNAALRNEGLTIEAALPRFNTASTIHITHQSPYPFDGELRIGDADLSLLGMKGANGQPLTGTLGANLQGSGNLQNFAQSRLSAQIQTLQAKAGDRELHIRNPIQLEYRNNSLEISSAAFVSGNSMFEIAGSVPVRQPASAGALGIKGQIDIAQATGFISMPEGFAATGTIDLDLFVSGTPQNLISSGTIAVSNATTNLPGIRMPLTGISLRANVDRDSILLQQADAKWGQGRITLTGELPFGLLPKNLPVQFPRKQRPATFSLDLTNIGLEESGLLPRGVGGLISLHAAGQADSADLRSIKAQIDFRDLSFRMNDISLEQRQQSVIQIRNGIASISRLSFGGAETSIDAYGSAGFLPKGRMDLRLTGNLNAALLTFRNRDLKATGKLKVALAVSGDRDAPRFTGLAEMKGAKLSLRNPRIVADSLTVRLALDPKRISIQEFKGTLNGGPMSVSGTAGYGREGLKDLNLKASVQDFFFNFPEGLKSSSTGNLTITSSNDTILVSGNARIQESSYREPFEVSSQLMSYLKGQQIVVTGKESDVLLDRVRLNLTLRTETPLLVQNNIAKVEGTANLRLVGSFNEPSMVGRVTLSDGGEIILNQRTYYINRGVITLTNEAQIEPILDIQAQTKAGDYDITLRLTGTLERLSTTLTSEPPLSEPDIFSLLLTGKTASETQGRELQMARTQALALIAGQAGSELAGEARRALHLSTLRIDPGLIASESDAGARLTLGEDITKNLSIVYSMNLTNGGDQIWTAEYEIIRRLTTQATKQQDNTYRFEFHHDLLFGGPPSTRRSRTSSQKFEIGAISLEGGAPFSEKELMNRFRVKPGQKYDFPRVQKGLDRLREFYANEDRLEADVRLHRETQEKTVDLNLDIEPGPTVAFSFEGAPISSGAKEEVKKAWTNGVFDTERIEDSVRAIRMPLLEAGFLQSEVTHKIETEDSRKLVHFQITAGARYNNIPIVISGASEISAGELNNALEKANVRLEVYADPQKVVDYLSRYYRDRGFLQARINSPLLRLDPKTGTGSVSIQIQEGPLFTIGNLEFNGNHAFDYDGLWSVIPTSSGSSYDPNTLRDAIKAVENLYHSRGYNDVSVAFRIIQDSSTARANLTFYIAEHKQSIIREIAVEGTHGTSQDFVERQLDFQTGDVLDFAKINETRKRLYSTAVYSSVDFQTEELPAPSPDPRTKDVRVRVRVREIKPYRFQYGLFYDTERGVGGILEAENRNFLGRASDVGLRLRYDTDLQEGRLYFYQPFVTKLHLKMDGSAFVQRETRPAFSTRRIGFSLFQQKNLPKSYHLDYGYRYDHVRWNGLPPDPTIFQASAPVARLVATLTRDTRDSVLDATRGEFSSHSLEFGPRFLGSETGFTRYYGQYFRYVPLDKFLFKTPPDKKRSSGPTRLVYAGALRLGLTEAFGGKDVISPERFFAGGGTTMRGFQQDLLGPTETLADGTVRPTGGEALFLFNNEIRFPIFGILHGVGFVDIGNVYPRISDFSFSLRKSAGAGLRLKIKFVPIRFDYGFKLDRRPGERKGAFFFSIGQAF